MGTDVRGAQATDLLTVQDRTRQPKLSRVDVLVLDAHNRQSLACTREYGKRGLGVGAVACVEDAVAVPTFASRWCAMRAVVPSMATEPEAFVEALLALIDRYQPQMVLPGHDGSIDVLREHRSTFERRTVLPIASEAALAVAVSKQKTLEVAQKIGITLPRSVLVTEMTSLPAALHEIGTPAVVKPLQSWVEANGVGERLVSNAVTSLEQAQNALHYILSHGCPALLQQWLPGRREAVSFLYGRGTVWARFAQASHREFPALGGVSVLSESISLLPDIVEPAERLIREIDLEGCSMVEFRRDVEGRPVLMEINPRIGGSAALAIMCGVNFPNLLFDWAMGNPLTEVNTYRVGRRLRWLGGDIWNLKTTFNNQGQPDVPPGRQAVATFFLDFVRRPSSMDFAHPIDMRPAFVELQKTLLLPYREKLRKARAARRARRFSTQAHVGKAEGIL